jgi:membrane protein implicated in regulation of membrane protease activity
VPLWLILIIIGVVLLILGFAGIADILIWIGVIILVVSLVLAVLNRVKK